jgi:hypothetical protein
MAAEGEVQKEVATHRKGYLGFLEMMKWGAAISFVVALIVIFLIAD